MSAFLGPLYSVSEAFTLTSVVVSAGIIVLSTVLMSWSYDKLSAQSWAFMLLSGAIIFILSLLNFSGWTDSLYPSLAISMAALLIYTLGIRAIEKVELAQSNGFSIPGFITSMANFPLKIVEKVSAGKFLFYIKTVYFSPFIGFFMLVICFNVLIFSLSPDEISLNFIMMLFFTSQVIFQLQRNSYIMRTIKRKTLFYLIWTPLAFVCLLGNLNTFSRNEKVKHSDISNFEGEIHRITLQMDEVENLAETGQAERARQKLKYLQTDFQNIFKAVDQNTLRQKSQGQYVRTVAVRFLLWLTVLTLSLWSMTFSRASLSNYRRLIFKTYFGLTLMLGLFYGVFFVENKWALRQGIRDFIWSCENNFIFAGPTLLLLLMLIFRRCRNNFNFLEYNLNKAK